MMHKYLITLKSEWQAIPLFGIQWLHGFFFTGLGSALIASTGGSGTTAQLAQVMDIHAYGYTLIVLGLLFFVVKFEHVLYALCLGLIPYLFAAISFYVESGSLQAMSFTVPFQAFLFIGIYAESVRRSQLGGKQ